jgi:hypothetical protein
MADVPAPAPPTGKSAVLQRMGAAAAVKAYQAGELAAEDAAALEADINEGRLLVPRSFKLAGGTPAKLWDAPQPAPKEPEPGLIDKARALPGKVADMVTGNDRRTEETEALPDFLGMPELNTVAAAIESKDGERLSSMASAAKSFLGAGMANADEAVKVIKANFPDTKIRQDEKGNTFLTSSIDGKEYAVKPGFRASDLPRVAGNAIAFAGPGKVKGIAKAGLAAAGAQLGIEGTQALTGGTFDAAEIALAGAGGAAIPAIAKLGKGVLGAIKGAPAAAAADVAEGVAKQVDAGPLDDAAMGKLLKRAARGDVAAQEELATRAAVNLDDKAAFDKLGLTVPADIVADNPQMRQLAGLVRSKVGGQAEAQLADSVTAVVEKADDVLKQFDAQFVDGVAGKQTVSAKVLDGLKSNQQDLKSQAAKLYSDVDVAMPKTTPVRLDSTRTLLRDIRKEVGDANLSSSERKLVALTDDVDASYGALLRAKSQIGDALASKASPFADVETGTLKRLYAALADDQLGNVERVAGAEARKQLRQANVLTALQKRLEKRMVQGFGKELEGDLGALMTRAAQGDTKSFARLKATVPPEMWRETVATSLASAFRKGDRFDLAGFASKYPALRENRAVYSEVVKALGPESDQLLSSLFRVSKRMTEARGLVKQTGKGNQGLEGLNAPDGLVDAILSSSVSRGLGAAAGAKLGPMGAAAGAGLVDALAGMRKPAMVAATELFNDPAFSQLMVTAATQGPQATKQAATRVATSSRWRAFAKEAGLPRDPKKAESFLVTALQSARAGSPEMQQ